jgi:hypothetical protein
LECSFSKFLQFVCLCFNLPNIIVGIWAINTFYNIDNMCYNFWITNANGIWIFVFIHYVLLFVIIFIYSIPAVYSLILCINSRRNKIEIDNNIGTV